MHDHQPVSPDGFHREDGQRNFSADPFSATRARQVPCTCSGFPTSFTPASHQCRARDRHDQRRRRDHPPGAGHTRHDDQQLHVSRPNFSIRSCDAWADWRGRVLESARAQAICDWDAKRPSPTRHNNDSRGAAIAGRASQGSTSLRALLPLPVFTSAIGKWFTTGWLQL